MRGYACGRSGAEFTIHYDEIKAIPRRLFPKDHEGFTIHYGEIKTTRRSLFRSKMIYLQSTMVRLRPLFKIHREFNPDIYNPLW